MYKHNAIFYRAKIAQLFFCRMMFCTY